MKPDIHPTYHTPVTVQCACGNSFVTGSTEAALKVEICANCHPFYTGKHKLVDTAGRVDKFRQRLSHQVTERKSKKKVSKKPVTVTRIS